MRYYTFTNFMLSSIQQGIQPAHCIADTFIKYSTPSCERDVLLDWATTHKTMICLNGGFAAGIRDIYSKLPDLCAPFNLPYCFFREDAQSLDETMTCCGMVVPEMVYNIQPLLLQYSQDPTTEAPGWLQDAINLADFLSSFSLAK